MDRPIIYDQADVRDYDHLWGWRENLFALAQAVMDLLGTTSTLVAGFAATPTAPASLTINLAAGDIYQMAAVDTTTYGSLAADTNQVLQQGLAAAQQVVLSTAGLGSGQSRWALIQAQFVQEDEIPSDDPNGGLLPYLNASNPSGPAWSGPNNSGQTQPTRRISTVVVGAVYGNVATSGSEVPPNPTAGWVPLYLIDLAFGQTQVTASEILAAGPSVGTNVPTNYPQAPFLAGLLNSHHGGITGQAPRIKLASEVQGILPPANGGVTRTTLTANTTFYVSTTGSDSNNGLSSGTPWATLQHAYNTIQTTYDLAGFVATIQLANGTYTANLNANGPLVGAQGASSLVINGNSATPTNVIISVSGNFCIGAASGAQLTVQNLEVSGIYGLLAQLDGLIIFNNLVFGACTTAHMNAANGGVIEAGGNYTISGNAAVHWLAAQSGEILVAGATVTLSGTPAFSSAFASANGLGDIVCPAITFSGSATGQRYIVASNAVVNTNGAGASYLPGNAAGSPSTGGQYI